MKFKKVVSAVLVSALAVSMMAGCGSKSGSSDSKSDVFKIGGIGPMTGDAAAYGEAVDNGAKLAVEEINKNGGINGKQVEFKTEDDQADAEKAVNAYNTLKDWGMQILMGTVTSGSCTAVASETDSDHMFQITPSGTAVESVQDHDNVFRLCFSDPEQGTKSAEYIAKNKLATKIAVIYNSSDVYSNGIYTNFAAEAKKEGLDVVAAEAFTADNKTDFSVQLKKAQSSGADLVFLPIYYQEASAILQQAAKLDYHPTFFGCDGLDGILGVEGFDKSLAEGTMLLTPYASDAQDEKTQTFTKAYEDKYGDTPIQFAADAYDAIYAIKAAVEKADVTPDMTIFQEEIFGPVVCVTPFDTEEEAIAIANSTKYGLAGGVFTKDIKRGLRVAQAIDSGQIYVNSYFSKGMIESPGTGWRESGLGVAGIQKYMISKTIFVDTEDGSVPY